jgi:hypothetical protein
MARSSVRKWESHGHEYTKRPRVRPGRRGTLKYGQLEGEIHAGADHAEVVVRPIHEIPAEIADPADVRR